MNGRGCTARVQRPLRSGAEEYTQSRASRTLPRAPGDAQADWFLQEVDKVGRQGLLLVLDWETNNSSAGTMTRENARGFVARVREKAGVVPVLYSYESFLLEELKTSPDEVLASCPLWVASYSAPPRVPSAWSDWMMWQYSGDVGGPADQHKFPRATPGFRCAVDRSAFKGTEDELRAWWEATAVRSSPQSTSMTG